MKASSTTSSPPRGRKSSATASSAVLADDPPVRIVRIDDDGEVGVPQLADVGDLCRGVPDEARDTNMLGIGRAQHRGTPGRHQGGNVEAAESACPAPRPRGRPTARRRLARQRRQPARPPRAPAGAEHLRRQPRNRIGMGIDPGRKVDERFRRAGKQQPRGAEIAAMRERRRIHVGHDGRRAHPSGTPDRGRRRLSGSAGARHRSSGHVDGPIDRHSRSHVEPREHEQCQPPGGGSRRHSDRHHRRGAPLRSPWSAACCSCRSASWRWRSSPAR